MLDSILRGRPAFNSWPICDGYAEAVFLCCDDRYSSIACRNAVGFGPISDYLRVPKIRALFEDTFFAGLRKAGMLEG
jgi:hypothetical protein